MRRPRFRVRLAFPDIRLLPRVSERSHSSRISWVLHSAPSIGQFIDQHRGTYGVEPICAVLPIAPSTYFLHKACQQDPAIRSPRHRRDDELRAICGTRTSRCTVRGKVWRQLRREGARVARCNVERLMRAMGLRGVSRGRAWVLTTRPEAGAFFDRRWTTECNQN